MPVYPNVSFLGHLCQFQTESLPWQPTCESATQTATSDAHSGNIHLCFLYSSKNCTVELYKQPGSPVGPVQLASRPARPPSYLPSLSKLWKSPADLQPSCHSENVRCRRKSLHLLLRLDYHWKQVALAECSSSIGSRCIGKRQKLHENHSAVVPVLDQHTFVRIASQPGAHPTK